jgi:hypothetical protein
MSYASHGSRRRELTAVEARGGSTLFLKFAYVAVTSPVTSSQSCRTVTAPRTRLLGAAQIGRSVRDCGLQAAPLPGTMRSLWRGLGPHWVRREDCL